MLNSKDQLSKVMREKECMMFEWMVAWFDPDSDVYVESEYQGSLEARYHPEPVSSQSWQEHVVSTTSLEKGWNRPRERWPPKAADNVYKHHGRG
jgi:hypothetical protein